MRVETSLQENPDEKDLKRVEKLVQCKIGSGHNNFLVGVVVQMLITAPSYWYPQFQRYHFADIISSQSKMHRLLKMDLKTQCNQWVNPIILDLLKKLIEEYENLEGNQAKNDKFQEILSNCPMGLNLSCGITTNYMQLRTIYFQRKHHKLQEWKVFCEMVEKLPMSHLITAEANYA